MFKRKRSDLNDNLFIKSADGYYLSFEKVYRTHITSLIQYGLKFTKDTELVKDSVHELFVDIYRYRNSLGEIYKLKPYLMKALRLKLRKSLMATRKNISLRIEEFAFSPEYSIEQAIEKEETEQLKRKILLNLLNKLSSRQKEALYLRFEEEMDYDEISKVMECSYQSARNLIHRAITKIRAIVTENEINLLRSK